MKIIKLLIIAIIIAFSQIYTQEKGILTKSNLPEETWTKEDIISVYNFIYNNDGRDSIQLSTGRVIKAGGCGTPIVRELDKQIRKNKSDIPELKTNKIKETELIFKTENFVIHYYIDGNDQVTGYDQDNEGEIPLPDGTQEMLVDGTGPSGSIPYSERNAPDYIEKLGIYAEYSLKKMIEFGFNYGKKPDWLNDIWVLNIGAPGIAISPEHEDQKYKGMIQIASYLGDDSLKVTVPHEIFHHFQYTYDYNEKDWIVEGTAKWMEDCIFDEVNLYKREANIYLSKPEICLTNAEYEAVLYWKYFSEQYSKADDKTEPQVGVKLMKELWDKFKDKDSTEAIDQVLTERGADDQVTKFESSFQRFALANYIKNYGDPYPDSRFDYIEDVEEPIYWHVNFNKQYEKSQKIILSYLDPSKPTLINSSVNPWGVDYYKFLNFGSLYKVNISLQSKSGNPFWWGILCVKNSIVTNLVTSLTEADKIEMPIFAKDFDELVIIVSTKYGASEQDYKIYITSVADNTSPELSIVSPGVDETVSDKIDFSVDVSDYESGIKEVEFYVNGNLYATDDNFPYSVQLSKSQLQNGSNILKAVARDFAGNITEKSTTVTVSHMVRFYDATETPAWGNTATNYQFSVSFMSSLNKPPENDLVYVNIGGVNYQMSHGPNPNWSNGVTYTFNKNDFIEGVYNYYFSTFFNGQELKILENNPITVKPNAEGWDLRVVGVSPKTFVKPGETFDVTSTIYNGSNTSDKVYNNVPYEIIFYNPSGTILDTKTGLIPNLAQSNNFPIKVSFTAPQSPAGNFRIVCNIKPELDNVGINNSSSNTVVVGNTGPIKQWLIQADDNNVNLDFQSNLTHPYKNVIYELTHSDGEGCRLKKNGNNMTEIKIYDFIYNDGSSAEIIVNEMSSDDNAVVSWGSSNLEYMKFNNTTYTCHSGESAYFEASCTNDGIVGDYSIYRNPEMQSWKKYHTFPVKGDNSQVNYEISVPSGASTGTYTFFIGCDFTSNKRFVRQLEIVVIPKAPEITQISKTYFSADDQITITGINLGAGGSVMFGNTKATIISSWTPTSITCVVPDGVKEENLFIVNTNGTSNGIPYKVLSSTGDPEVISSVPDQIMDTKGPVLICTLNNLFSDPNGDALTYQSSTSSNSVQVNQDSLKVGKLYITSSGDIDETVTVIITATDKTNASVSETFLVHVKNNTPVFYSIDGAVTYENASNTSLNGIRIYLKKGTEKIDSALTDNQGKFIINGLSNGTYNYEVKSTKRWEGVTSIDALFILKHVVGSLTLQNLKLQAADVNLSNTVSAADAALVLQRVVGRINSFTAGDWIFDSADNTTIDGVNATRNFKGIIVGDVNGSYNSNIAKINQTIIVDRGDKLPVNPEKEGVLPVFINTRTTLGAFMIELDYSSDKIDVVNVNSKLRDLIYSCKDGKIKVAWCSLTPLKINEKEELFTVNFKVKEKESTPNDLRFDVNESFTEFADENINIHDVINLLIPEIEISSPKEFSVNQNYPNPFNPSTVIEYALPIKGQVRLEVFSVLGERLCTLVDQIQEQGTYKVQWNAEGRQSGIYIYRIVVKGETTFSQCKKMILMK